MKHLLGIKDLSIDDIDDIMTRAFWYKNYKRKKGKTPPHIILENKFVGTLFFENSTRTVASFEIAAKRLGGEVINLDVNTSSVSKGESVIDTAITLDEMDIDFLVIRSGQPNICHDISKVMSAHVINAGDGANEHPTQALLDSMVLTHNLNGVRNKRIAICGDVRNSRVANSSAYLLNKLGAEVNFVCPPELAPHPTTLEDKNVNVFHTMKDGLKDCDAVMMLRIQFERMHDQVIEDVDVFHQTYGLTWDTLSHAKNNALVLHPGPWNREVEISSEVADSERCRAREQVKHGVFMRMAIFDWLYD